MHQNIFYFYNIGICLHFLSGLFGIILSVTLLVIFYLVCWARETKRWVCALLLVFLCQQQINPLQLNVAVICCHL